jgi:hypothetical protein
MKTPFLLSVTLATCFVSGTSIAGENEFYESPMQASARGGNGLSRAEVQADLEIWRKSGLAELDRLEVPPLSTREYQDAVARYEALRRAPEFAARVRSLGGRKDAVAVTKLDISAGR